MRIVKKIISIIIILFLFIYILPTNASSNVVEFFYYNKDENIEDLSASLLDLNNNLISILNKENYQLNDSSWYKFYLEDENLKTLKYKIELTSETFVSPLEYTFTNTTNKYYLNDYIFSDLLDDLTTYITYATFTDRKQIKFFTNFQVSEYEVKLLKNDTYLNEDDYLVSTYKTQNFINLSCDVDFNSEYYIEIVKNDGLKSALKLVTFDEIYATGFFQTLFNYNGKDLGINYKKDETIFKVWAPTLSSLTLNLYNTDNNKETYPMEQINDGVFYYKALGDLANYEYTYSFKRNYVDYEIIDPYTKYVSNDRGLIIDLNSTSFLNFSDWEPKNVLNSYADYVVYESSVKELTAHLNVEELKNRYLGLIENNLTLRAEENKKHTIGLDHLKELGITHLSLDDLINTNYSLSVINNKYRSKTNIGAEITELKQLIKTLNENGINIILNLNLYNKPISSLKYLMPGYYYEAENNLLDDDELAFFETNHYMTNKYLESQISYLINEFKFKGLKLNPLNGLRIDYLNKELREIAQDEQFLLYGEFNNDYPLNIQNKLIDTELLDQVKHVGFIDENRFSLNKSFINSNSSDGLKGYILSSSNSTYNTLSPKQSFKRLNYFEKLSKEQNKQLKTLQFVSYGIPVIKGGEEIGFYSNEPLDYNFKDENIELFNLYKTLISFRRSHPSLQILDYPTLVNNIKYKVKDDVVTYHMINGQDSFPHILIIHNFGDKNTTTLPEGLKGHLNYNVDGEFNWQVAFDSLNYYPLEKEFINNEQVELQKNQSLILHFGLNKENIIESPIQTPKPPEESNLTLFWLISSLLVISLGISITFYLINSTNVKKP